MYISNKFPDDSDTAGEKPHLDSHCLRVLESSKKIDEKCPAHVNFAMGRPQALQFTAELGFGEKPWGSRGWASVLGNST